MSDESEEIFRRAAESYPLKTDNADWEAVLKKMQGTDDGAGGDVIKAGKKRNYRPLLLLLLLLIPFAFIEYKYSGFSNLFGKKKDQQTTSATVASAKTVKETTEQASIDDKTIKKSKENNKENTPVVADINQTTSSTPGRGETSAVTNPQAVAKQTGNQAGTLTHWPGKNDPVLAKHRSSQKANGKINITNSDEGNEVVEKINKPNPKISYSSKQKTRVNIKSEAATGDEAEHKIASTEIATATVGERVEQKISTEDNNAIVKKEGPVEKKSIPDSAKTVEKVDAVKKVDKEEKKKKSPEKHFYAGLIVGPDFSTVKLQSVKRTGLSYGALIGYRISKKFSIETGFQYDKKMYSSKGQYFSTKNIPLYPNTTIDYVSGQCNMYEIPLNVRYTFSQKKKSTWFASAGISSYLMNKEKYDYTVMYFGTTYPYSKDYKSHDNQFAAVINISAGYTYKIGRIGDLRIEPYLKLPVHKVGTGELPIQSGGIMIGFTRNLF